MAPTERGRRSRWQSSTMGASMNAIRIETRTRTRTDLATYIRVSKPPVASTANEPLWMRAWRRRSASVRVAGLAVLTGHQAGARRSSAPEGLSLKLLVVCSISRFSRPCRMAGCESLLLELYLRCDARRTGKAAGTHSGARRWFTDHWSGGDRPAGLHRPGADHHSPQEQAHRSGRAGRGDRQLRGGAAGGGTASAHERRGGPAVGEDARICGGPATALRPSDPSLGRAADLGGGQSRAA